MALFSNGNGKEHEMTRQTKGNGAGPAHVNMVGEGTVLEGTLQSDGDVRVSGRVIGKLKVGGKVSVAPEGAIEGEVVAASADVSGRVQGDLIVEERLLLRSTARVEGNIRTRRLIMEEGAAFDGQCEMQKKEAGPDARAGVAPVPKANGEASPSETPASPKAAR